VNQQQQRHHQTIHYHHSNPFTHQQTIHHSLSPSPQQQQHQCNNTITIKIATTIAPLFSSFLTPCTRKKHQYKARIKRTTVSVSPRGQ